MRTVTLHRYYLPNRNPRGKPYASSWHMTEEDAKKHGAVGVVPGTAKEIEQAETFAECMDRAHTTTSGSESPSYRCLQCEDGLWVCADHPAVAWDEGKGCSCGAEGAPCPACNPEGRMPPGVVAFAEVPVKRSGH